MSKKSASSTALETFLQSLPPRHTPAEIIYTADDTAACDGGDDAIGHPRVYVTINNKTGFTVCGYCGRIYVQDAARAVGKKSAAH